MKLGLTEKQYNHLLTLISETELEEQSEPPAAEPEKGTSDKQAGGQGYPEVGKWESGVTRGPGNQVGITKWSDVVGSKLTRSKGNQLKEQSTPNLIPIGDNYNKLFKGKEKPTPPIPAIEKYPNNQQMDKNGNITYPYEKKNMEGNYLYWYYKSPIKSIADVGFQDKLNIKYRQDLNSWMISNMNMTLEDWERYHGRKSKSGKNVPKGFNPDLYDEYLSKEQDLRKRATDMLKKTISGDPKDKQKYDNIIKQLDNLKKEYSNSEFSYGITKDELNQYNEKKKLIDDYYGNMLKSIGGGNNSQSILEPIKKDNTYIPKNINIPNQIDTSNQYNLIKKEWSEQLKTLDLLFGKDNWTKDVSILGQEFDRIWDKWGSVIQIIGNIAIIAVSGGIAGVVEGAAGAIGFTVSSGALRAAAPYVADSVFNTLIGTYESSRGKNEEALISFLCAMVPYVTYGKNIGKVSIETAEGLSKKIILNKFDTKESMDRFIKSLTPEERYIFRETMSLPKETIKTNFDLAVKQIGKTIKGAGLKIPKAGISIWGPLLSKQLSVEGGIPVSAAIINALFKFIQNNEMINLSSDDLIKTRQYLDGKLKNSSPPTTMMISDKIVEGMGNGSIKTFFDVKNVVNEMIYNEPTDEDIDYLNKKYGKYGLNLSKYKKTKKVNPISSFSGLKLNN